MSEKKPVEGKFIMYKGKPLVREKNVICYGNMTDKYYLFMMVLTTKKVGNEEIPDNILVQVLTTGPNPKIIKQGNKSGFHDAFDIGTIWLERALAEGNN